MLWNQLSVGPVNVDDCSRLRFYALIHGMIVTVVALVTATSRGGSRTCSSNSGIHHVVLLLVTIRGGTGCGI